MSKQQSFKNVHSVSGIHRAENDQINYLGFTLSPSIPTMIQKAK